MHSVTKREIARASEVLGKAFFDDPIWKGFVPDDDRRGRFLPALFEFILRLGYAYGHLWASSDRLEGVAIWFPAKTASIGFFRMLFGGLFGHLLRVGSAYKPEMRDIQKNMSVLEKDRKRLMKGRNHLYLAAIGVSPDHQGNGHAGTLLRALFNVSAEQNIPIYLETETEKNVHLYEHYGFETISERDFSHKGFHIWQMVRPPTGTSAR